MTISSKCLRKERTLNLKKMNKNVKKTSSQMSTESESDFLLTQLDSQCDYSPEKIKAFLEQTKEARLPNVGEVFPDPQLFISSARPLTMKSYGEEVLTEQAIYRLKKLILKVRAQISMMKMTVRCFYLLLTPLLTVVHFLSV